MPAIPLAIPLLYLCAFVVAYGLLIVYRGQSEDADGGLKGLLLWLAEKFDAVHVPHLGGHGHFLSPVADAITWVANAVDRALGAAVGWFEAPVAQFWHLLAEVPAQTAEALASFATFTAHKFVNLEREVVPREINRALRGPRSKIAAALASLAALSGHVIPGLWGAIDGLDARVGRTARQARAHARRLSRVEEMLGAAAMTVAVGLALNRLGLRWLRCSALKRIGRNHGCSPWQALEHLLAPALDVLVFVNVCEVASLIRRAAKFARPVMTELLVAVDAALCHGHNKPPPTLPLPTLHLSASSPPLDL